MAVKKHRIRLYRMRLVRDSDQSALNRQISEPADAAAIIARYLQGEDRENLVVLLLDKNRCVLGINTVAIGSISSVLIHPREVFKPAFLTDAVAIILGHNHPNGDPKPTAEDIRITQELVAAGHALQIPVLDHIIVGANGKFISLAERGIIPEHPDEE